MGLTVEGYPKQYQKNIRTILGSVRTDPQTAYAMMLMTATLMDLDPAGEEVAEMVIEDCKAASKCG